MTRRRELAIVAGITLLGAALRLYQIGAQSLWLDELFSVFLASRDWGAIVAGTAQDIAPPLYYFLLHLTMQFGSDETAVRVVSFVSSTAMIPLFYALARGLFDARVAFLATLALALSPFHIYFAQEARMYALLAFFSLAAMFFFLRAWRNGGALDWAFFALAMTLAFYTHSLAMLNLLAIDVFALLQSDGRREHWKGLALTHAAIFVLFAPWLAVFVQQTTRVQSEFIGATQLPLALFVTPYLFLFSNVVPTFLVPFTLFAGLALLAFALVAAARSIVAPRADASGVLFALATFVVPLLVLYLLSFVHPIFVERRLLPASFGLYLLLAWAVGRIWPPSLNAVFGSVVLLGMVIALSNYYFDPATQKPPMRQAARALVAQFRTDDAVVHTSDSSALAFMYYAPELPNQFLAGDLDYVNQTNRGRAGEIAGLVPKPLEAIVAGHLRVWLVVALDHNIEYQKARVREFDAAYGRAAEQNVGGIDLLLYEVRH